MSLNKEKVMQALFEADCNLPSDVVNYIGANLPFGAQDYVPFDHDQKSVFEACGVTERHIKDLNRAVNDYMHSLDDAKKSMAVEFIVNSGNQLWIRAVTSIGLQAMEARNDKDDDGIPEDFKKLLMAALKRKMRDKSDEDED